MKSNSLTIFLVVVILLLVGGFIYMNQGKNKTTITSTGNSVIESIADQVSVYVGIETLENTAEESKNENAEISDKVLNSLQSQGIKKEEIETSSYNIYPDYNYDNGKQTLKGYKTVNILKIKTKDFTKIGKIVDASINSGATTIQNINFELSQEKQNEIKIEAIAKASEDAKLKAQATVQGLGAKLGKVKSVEIQDYNYYPIPFFAAESGGDVRKVVSTEILPDKLQVSANVNVVFEID
jgi:uncharacterized protein YggE